MSKEELKEMISESNLPISVCVYLMRLVDKDHTKGNSQNQIKNQTNE